MSNRIDWAFIAELEGALITEGYVPNSGRSGVTIATGFDIGQRNAGDLARLFGRDSELYRLFEPYLGLERANAVAALTQSGGLRISRAQALEVNERVKGEITALLVQRYDLAVARENTRNSRPPFDYPVLRSFAQLPREAQTVIVSVEFQYGSAKDRTPNFWRQMVRQDWAAAHANLQNFGDAYPTRRRREAAYLLPIVAHDFQQIWPGIPYRLDLFAHPEPAFQGMGPSLPIEGIGQRSEDLYYMPRAMRGVR